MTAQSPRSREMQRDHAGRAGRRRRALTVLLAQPRGFCAGVERAIQMVERAIEIYGAPVYVRHEIVHNRHVVERLAAMGAVFIGELDEAPDDRPVILSAHGVPKSVTSEAQARRLLYFDATCPLVSKVHLEVERHHQAGRHVVLVGHAGHPEVVGTVGQVPQGAVSLVETIEDVAQLAPPDPARLAFVTQTTLSIADTALIVEALSARFPGIVGPNKGDICYATTNRQAALQHLARADLVLVVGSPQSSNALRLVDAARALGKTAHLLDDAAGLSLSWLDEAATVGITSAASTPESSVRGILARLDQAFDLQVEEGLGRTEDIRFKLPRALL